MGAIRTTRARASGLWTSTRANNFTASRPPVHEGHHQYWWYSSRTSRRREANAFQLKNQTQPLWLQNLRYPSASPTQTPSPWDPWLIRISLVEALNDLFKSPCLGQLGCRKKGSQLGYLHHPPCLPSSWRGNACGFKLRTWDMKRCQSLPRGHCHVNSWLWAPCAPMPPANFNGTSCSNAWMDFESENRKRSPPTKHYFHPKWFQWPSKQSVAKKTPPGFFYEFYHSPRISRQSQGGLEARPWPIHDCKA